MISNRFQDRVAKKVVTKIIEDLCGRSGGDYWFESCDEDIQEEIRAEWETIVRNTLKAEE